LRVQAGKGSTYDHLLDLGHALEDREDLGGHGKGRRYGHAAPIGLSGRGTDAPSSAVNGFTAAHGHYPRYACWRRSVDRRYPVFMTMSREHIDLHRMVDRLDPDQVHALRAVAQQLLRPSAGRQDADEAAVSAADSLLADEPVRDFSFIGLFNGAPDLSERSEEILREEFAKRADADR
jgi:hypothetical protein